LFSGYCLRVVDMTQISYCLEFELCDSIVQKSWYWVTVMCSLLLPFCST